MALVGYARVSSVGQRLDVQVAKLQHCDKLFQEQTSGSTVTRPRLVDCLDYVREGDTLVVTRLDRLARSTWHLCQIAEILARKRVHLHVLDQSIDTSDATGRLLFHMLGAIAQFETELWVDPINEIEIAQRFIPRLNHHQNNLSSHLHRLQHPASYLVRNDNLPSARPSS